MVIGLEMGLLGSTGRRIAVSARSILDYPRNGVREKEQPLQVVCSMSGDEAGELQ